jgi:phosphoesterase RecJ-like protein
MNKFISEFNTLQYVIGRSKKVLLFAHSGPDGDTVGAVLALKALIQSLGKEAVITCPDPFPEFLRSLSEEKFELPEQLELASFDVIIACDSVERGFHKIAKDVSDDQLLVLIDHHPDINLSGDLNIVDAEYSSVCEIIYDFFIYTKVKINQKMANFLALGILGDTGVFQNANTTVRVMEIVSELMRRGASASKIVEAAFTNKKLSTLRLWGKAFEKAKINPKNGMIVTVVTQEDMERCGANADDLAQVASILNTVPGTSFSLILSERGGGVIKGSLRSEEYKGVDVSSIAHRFGGGGHKLASGFEVRGKVRETENGWEIV